MDMNFKKYKTVSFDIFDTLVSRRIYRPRDLFSLMQSTLATEKFFISAYEIGIIDNFPEIRVQAEVSARENRVRRFGGEPEILISEIYDEILKKHPQLSPATVKKIIDLEIQMEKIVLYKNARGSCLFEKAISDGCKVILISDMYLPSAILKELLTSCGYDISNIPVYSSGEERYSKNSGKLFSIVKKNENVDIASWMHVGDNVHADILNAKKLGINTQHREVYADYFKTACEGYKNIALIDVGWMGNIQSVFARSLGAQWAEKQIHGFYLATFAGANDNRSIYNKMFGWLTNYGHPNDKCDLFLSGGVEIMEFAMADNTGSTIGYKKTDNGIIPVREDSSGSEIEYLKKAARLQSGIISFFEYVKPLIQKGNYAALSSVVLSEPFFELIARPSSAQLDALSSLTHSESAGSNAERIVLAKKLPLKDKLFPGENYIKELNASYWKEGFKRINRKKFWAKYN